MEGIKLNFPNIVGWIGGLILAIIIALVVLLPYCNKSEVCWSDDLFSKKTIGAGALTFGTNLYRQSGMVWRQGILTRDFINNFIITGYDFSADDLLQSDVLY